MGNPYGGILTGIGLLEGGKLKPAARKKYVEEVLALLATGNGNGKGGSPSTKIFNSLVPLPPIPGPVIPNVTTLAAEPLFWFDPDPLATLMATTLVDEKACPTWNMMFPDTLYAKTAEALDAKGSTPLFPILDYSAAFDVDLPFPITPPELQIKLAAKYPTLPQLMVAIADLGIELKMPSIPIPPIPPPFPDFSLGFDFSLGLKAAVALPEFLIGLIKLPFDLLLSLVLPPNLGLVLDLIALKFDAVIKLALDIVVKLLQPLIPIVPKLLIASILIYLKNILAMVIVDIVGMIVGAGGTLTKTVAGVLGLI